jgi:hypothetical protein
MNALSGTISKLNEHHLIAFAEDAPSFDNQIAQCA